MQVIYYGAPGTGKSYTIDNSIIVGVPDDYVFRVTFYPDYSYSDFIGQLLPVVLPSSTPGGSNTITYSFEKGIFTRALEKAYEDLSKDVYLIIEEMSRGDCAAILGDLFQLLDRERVGINKGYSKYFINNALISKDIIALPGSQVKLPPNFHIFGTMNTSDQNVYTMDTAFKRRFDWEYISTEPVLDKTTQKALNNVDIPIHDGTTLTSTEWCNLYQKLNEFISDEKYLALGEDKQLGQFFIEFDLGSSTAQIKEKVKNKLLHFLWNDIHLASYKSNVRLFDPKIGSFGILYKEYENDSKIFSDEFLNII